MHCKLTGLSFQLSVMARERGSRLIPCSCELRGGSARGERPTRKAAGGFWGIGIMSPISKSEGPVAPSSWSGRGSGTGATRHTSRVATGRPLRARHPNTARLQVYHFRKPLSG